MKTPIKALEKMSKKELKSLINWAENEIVEWGDFALKLVREFNKRK